MATIAQLGMVEILEKNGIELNGDRTKFEDAVKINSDISLKTDANEVEHTTNTGFGEELVPTDVFMNQVLELIPQYSNVIGAFTGNHGTGLPKKITLPIIGEEQLFDTTTEWTTGAGTIEQPDKKIATDQLSIEQFGYGNYFGISRDLLNYSAVDRLESIFMDKIARGAARTVDAVVLNGDATTAATGNVNSDDLAPVGTEYFLNAPTAGGLRKVAIDAGDTVDIATFALADFIAMRKVLGNFADSDLVWITNTTSHLSALGVTEVINNQYDPVQSQASGTIVPRILGIPVIRAKDIGLTDADGKINKGAGVAANTQGSFLLVHKAAVQFGFGQTLDISQHRNAVKGITLAASFDFGFNIATKLADNTTPSVVYGINATV